MRPYKQNFMYLNGELEHVFKKGVVPTVEMIQNVLIDNSGLYECAVRQSVSQIDKNLRSGYGLNGIDVRLEIMERPQ